MLRKPLLLAPVALAALLLSGCVWAYELPTDGLPVFYVTQGVTHATINNCSAKHPGDNAGRATCVLDEIGAVCATQQVAGGGKAEPGRCEAMGDHSNRADMTTAIAAVLASNRNDPQCLDYWYQWGATSCVG